MGASRWTVVGLVLAQAAIVLVGADLYASTRNTLDGHPRWTSTKAGLAKQVMSASAYTTSRQTMAGDHLDLSAFHGFQEVLHADPVEFDELRLRVLLEDEAYVHLLFGRVGESLGGVRLSRHPLFDEVFFEVSAEGAFTFTAPVHEQHLAREGWMDVALRFSDDGVELALDGAHVGRFTRPIDGPRSFGFRGGEAVARIDDVTLRHRGRELWTEDFSNTPDRHVAWGLGALGLLGLDLLVLAFARARRWHTRQALFGLLTGMALLLLVAVGVFLVYRVLLDDSYGPADPAAERAWRDAHLDEVSVFVRESWAPRADLDDTIRVLFVGTSQTWGAGASTADRTFVRRIERTLAEAFPERHVTCLNAGVMGSRLPRLFPLYRDEWLPLQPDLVIVNLSNNDHDADVFSDRLDRLARRNRSAGVATVFALEPNSVEHTPGPLPLHAAMREVAETHGIPVVDLHASLRGHSSRGFLWWDFVHVADEGHRRIAELLTPAITEALTDRR